MQKKTKEVEPVYGPRSERLSVRLQKRDLERLEKLRAKLSQDYGFQMTRAKTVSVALKMADEAE